MRFMAHEGRALLAAGARTRLVHLVPRDGRDVSTLYGRKGGGRCSREHLCSSASTVARHAAAPAARKRTASCSAVHPAASAAAASAPAASSARTSAAWSRPAPPDAHSATSAVRPPLPRARTCAAAAAAAPCKVARSWERRLFALQAAPR